MDIQSKTLLITQTLYTREELIALVSVVLYFDHRRSTYARATLGRTITGCFYSHEISRLQHCLERVCSYTLT